MSSAWHRPPAPTSRKSSHRERVVRRKLAAVATALSAAVMAFACGSDGTGPVATTKITTISIDTPSFAIERGDHKTLSATARDATGKIVVVPFAWRSSIDSVAAFEPNGELVAQDTGVVAVTASALGVTSSPIGVHVVWLGAAHLAAFNFVPPAAATPFTPFADSLRVLVTNLTGGPAPLATVSFTVTAGGGVVSSASAVTNAAGRAAVAWTFGPNAGLNTVAATVVDADGKLVSWVTPNPVAFSVTTFKAMSVVAGDQQIGQVLAALPVAPSLRLVDSTGKPRQGVPVTFTATNGGRVATPIISTGADGSASPGQWILGDTPGEQLLIASVESAQLIFHSTATGSPIHFKPESVIAGGSATCGLLTTKFVSCWGLQPLVGNADTANTAVPSPTKGGIAFASVDGGASHFCGVAADQSIYCWGVNSLSDTSGRTVSANQPTRLASAIAWSQVTAGATFNCAVAVDQTPYCWGANTNGQLGDRDTLTSFVPVQVAGGFKFSSVAAGTSHACGLTVDRTAFCWGLNTNGQLGDGTTAQRLAPTVVGGALSFQAIGTGDAWSCGLSTTGKAYCWGAVAGVSATQSTPLSYDSAPLFTTITVGGAHACALTGDGTAYCWGANTSGQVGDSTTVTRTAPTPVAGGFKFESISAGDTHTCGQTTDGSVLCWGLNRAGELGNNTAAFELTPRYIVLGVNP